METRGGIDLDTLRNEGCDAVLLAGDIGLGENSGYFSEWLSGTLKVPVFWVMGNHEYYHGDIDETERLMRSYEMQVAPKGGSSLLENQVAVLGDMRILGCVLWTDYELYGRPMNAMYQARRNLNDHRLITINRHTFMPQNALDIHERSRAWLDEELAKPWPGMTVVMTHHLPSPLSVSPQFQGDQLSPAFASDLTNLFDQADLWVHGHTHDSFDYTVGRCRVVCNPRGYYGHEANKHFNSSLILDLK